MKKKNVRAAAILTNDNKILLMYRVKEGKKYWVFPGGGKEDNESVQETVVREIQEEASIKCEIIRLIYTHHYSDISHNHYYYLCKYISGEPKLGDFNEAKTMKNENQIYEPRWIDTSKLPKMLIYPLEVRDWLIEDLKNNFKNTPKVAKLETTQLRQEL